MQTVEILWSGCQNVRNPKTKRSQWWSKRCQRSKMMVINENVILTKVCSVTSLFVALSLQIPILWRRHVRIIFYTECCIRFDTYKDFKGSLQKWSKDLQKRQIPIFRSIYLFSTVTPCSCLLLLSRYECSNLNLPNEKKIQNISVLSGMIYWNDMETKSQMGIM